MRKPAQLYTGEDIVEVYCHGGALCCSGARIWSWYVLEARAMLSPASLPSARF